ncbi:hypothetical protein ABIA39_001755 [Nocardia sp. GAS34]
MTPQTSGLPHPPNSPPQDGAVRLDGYRHKPAHTIDVFDIGGTRIALLVIPPTQTPTPCTRPRRPPPTRASHQPIDDLVAITMRDDTSDTETDAAEQRWDSEGGAGAY